MRVIDPKRRPIHRKTKNKYFVPWIIFAAIFAGLAIFFTRADLGPSEKNTEQKSSQSDTAQPAAPTFKAFTNEEFRKLYSNFAHPNTERISENSVITGNTLADEYIRVVAGGRGYSVQSAPVANNLITVEQSHKLQQKAAKPWTDMKADAAKSGISLSLTAAYRSEQQQSEIFLQRLMEAGIIIEQISSGRYASQLDRLLSVTAPPGYSRHHSGYTVDIACKSDPNKLFGNSHCFKWLSEHNYLNAKKYGWIPSYPPETEKQGPEPEEWEYVWVGVSALQQ